MEVINSNNDYSGLIHQISSVYISGRTRVAALINSSSPIYATSSHELELKILVAELTEIREETKKILIMRGFDYAGF